MTASSLTDRDAIAPYAPSGSPRRALFRDSATLLVNSGITSALGLAYWTLAARLTDASSVGLNGALISAMIALGSIGYLGITGAVMSYLPRTGPGARQLCRRAYVSTAGIGLLLGVAFAAVASHLSRQLSELHHPVVAVGFGVGVMVWALFGLQDGILVALDRSAWVPIENIGYSTMKMAMLVTTAGLGTYAITISWVVPAALSLPVVGWLTLRRLMPAHTASVSSPGPAPSEFWRFAGADAAASVMLQAAMAAAPLLIIARAGPAAGAYFVVPWLLVQSLDLVAGNVGMSLTVHGARRATTLNNLMRSSMMVCVTLIALIAGTVSLFAPTVLSIFGSRYAAESVTPLRLLLVASVGRVVVTLAVAAARARLHRREVFGLRAVMAVALIPAMWLGCARWGVNGAAAAWALSNCVAALAVIATTLMRRRSAAAVPA